MKRAGERGFSLLEVLLATALTIGVIVAATTAVSHAIHAVALADRHMALNDDALSALGDVRVASAYDDPATFSTLSGRASTMTLIGANGNHETISVSIAAAVATSNLLATATVSEGDLTVTQSQTIYPEAPTPGSSVFLATPLPAKN